MAIGDADKPKDEFPVNCVDKKKNAWSGRFIDPKRRAVMATPVQTETRKFTRGLGKPGTAAELRQSVSEVVRTSVLVVSTHLNDPSVSAPLCAVSPVSVKTLLSFFFYINLFIFTHSFFRGERTDFRSVK